MKMLPNFERPEDKLTPEFRWGFQAGGVFMARILSLLTYPIIVVLVMEVHILWISLIGLLWVAFLWQYGRRLFLFTMKQTEINRDKVL